MEYLAQLPSFPTSKMFYHKQDSDQVYVTVTNIINPYNTYSDNYSD
jgi:hypothetical protein